MHLLRYQVAVSLDGFIAPSDGAADWLNPYGKVAGEVMGPWMKQIGGIVIGRTTYDQAGKMGAGMTASAPTLVMTSRPLPKAAGVEASDDLESGLERLKACVPLKQGEGGDLWLFGGGKTAGQFLKAGLIDMIELTTVPVALGSGRKLFDGVAVIERFELVLVQQRSLGCLSTSYRRAAKTTRRVIPPKRRATPRSPRDSRSAGSR